MTCTNGPREDRRASWKPERKEVQPLLDSRTPAVILRGLWIMGHRPLRNPRAVLEPPIVTLCWKTWKIGIPSSCRSFRMPCPLARLTIPLANILKQLELLLQAYCFEAVATSMEPERHEERVVAFAEDGCLSCEILLIYL